MILDRMGNDSVYVGVHEKFSDAFAFIRKAVAENYPVGKYEIDGDKLFAMVQEYDTKLLANAKFEGHRRYIDIQYMVSGTETMRFADVSKLAEMTPYNPEKDCAFYQDSHKATGAVLEQGEYAIFFPHDIHMPGVSVQETPAPVKKIVVKVKL